MVTLSTPAYPMKTPTYLTPILSLIVAVFAATPLAAETREPSKVLIDFSVQEVERNGTDMIPLKKYSYSYGDWQDKITYVKPRGLLVPGLPGQGGFGGDKAMKLGEFAFAELVAVIGNQNEAQGIAVTLIDGDGTEATWYLPFGGKPKGAALVFRMNLAQCDKEEKPGKTPGLDKAKIKKWQIKGDWQPAKAEVLLVRLAASK